LLWLVVAGLGGFPQCEVNSVKPVKQTSAIVLTTKILENRSLQLLRRVYFNLIDLFSSDCLTIWLYSNNCELLV